MFKLQSVPKLKSSLGGLLKSFPRSISDSQVKNSAGPSSRPSPKKNLSMSASANVVAPASKSLTKSSDTAFKPNGLLSQSTASGSASAGPSSSRPTVDKSASSSSFKATGLLRKPRDVDLKTASSRAQASNRTVDTTRRSRLERQRQRSISSPSPPPSLRKSSPECINISSDSDVPAVTSNSKAKGKEKRKEKGKGKEMDNASSQLPRQRRNSGSVVITDFVPASSQKHSSQRQRKHLKSTSSVSSDDVIDLTKSDGEQDRMNGNARPRPRPSDTKSKPAEFIHILDSDEEEEPVPSARHKVPLPTPSTSSASAPKSNPVSSSAGSSDTLTRPSSNSARSPPTSKSNTPEPMDIDMGMDMDFDNDNDMIPEKAVSVDTSSFLASTSKTISARQASPGKAATPEGRVPEPTLSTSKPTKPESSSQLTSTLHSATEVGPSPKSLTGPQHTSPEAHSSQLHSAASSPRPPVGSLLHFTSAKAANVPALSAPGSPSKPNMASIASPSEERFH
ncbi:hypothetical protein CPB85DRAFT_908407 [Mucidula mucida]|nr:hypothetical protein CPB85DRAFT_908407 [Mucidula mucida]